MRCVQACLDKILALGLSDEGLQLGSGECVYEPGLAHDEEQHLGTSKSGELISLYDIIR